MKFDFDKGWSEAVAMIRSNFGLLATIAGVLVFLPATFAAIIFPNASLEASLGGSAEPSMEMLQAALITLFAEYWWLVLGVFLLTSLAQLAMFALLRRRASPTVGEAIGAAAGLLPSFIAAQVLQIIAILMPFFVLVSLPAAAGMGGIAAVGSLFMLPLIFYLTVKFSLTTAVIGVEGERNPVSALQRSWYLTKGNSFRLFGFYLLLAVAAFVLFLLTSWAVSLIFALGGDQVESFGAALFGGALDGLGAVLSVSVLASVHAQMTRLKTPDRGQEA